MIQNKISMCFSGSGGQGVILASIIFAEAAALSGYHTIQSQAYGPEARGGKSRAETMIGPDAIWFSKAGHPDFLLALNQTAYDAYAPLVREGGRILADSSVHISFMGSDPITKVLQLPIIQTAEEKVGKAIATNIVAVGAVNRLLDLFPEPVLEKAVRMHIPAGTEDLNLRALAAGEALAAAEVPPPPHEVTP